MSPLRPFEVLLLSLVGPLSLAVIFLLFPPGRGERGVESPQGESPRSRTSPVRVLSGTLPGGEAVRLFRGLTPGLDFGLPQKEAQALFGGGPDRASLITLLLCNQTPEERRSLAGSWNLRQGDRCAWALVPEPAAAEPRGAPLAALFTPTGTALPPGRVARHLFAGPEDLSGEEPLLLEGPGGLQVPLEAQELPAHRVLHFPIPEERQG